MFTVNSSMLQVQQSMDGTGATPRTPEILNSLMAMTDPFKEIRGARLASSPASEDGSSSVASSSPPSIQHTRTQLIKEGLKLTIQTKRRNNGETTTTTTTTMTPVVASSSTSSCLSDSSLTSHHLLHLQNHRHRPACPSDEVSQDSLLGDASGDGLTPEDEERRRRRRERNKIAATKCRMKKRERTVNLVQESEILESQNHELKSQIQELENERLRLVDMLTVHRPSCHKNGFKNSSPPYCESTYTRLTDASFIYSMPSTSAVNTSSSYHKISYQSTSAVEALYQRHQERRFCRSSASASTSESSVYSFDEGIVRDHSASSIIPSSSSGSSASSSYSCLKTNASDSPHDAYMRSDPIYTNLGGGGGGTESPRAASSFGCHSSVTDSPSSSSLCTRPSSLSLNTSSSDYESNTEMLDSPNLQSNLYSFDDIKDAHCYSTVYPANSCIT